MNRAQYFLAKIYSINQNLCTNSYDRVTKKIRFYLKNI